MQEGSARDQEILKCPRLERVMGEYEKNPEVYMDGGERGEQQWVL